MTGIFCVIYFTKSIKKLTFADRDLEKCFGKKNWEGIEWTAFFVFIEKLENCGILK